VVEIEVDEESKHENVYLKHLITGRYFPFNEENARKKLRLEPLLPSSTFENKLPPFHIFFDEEFFPKEFKGDQSICGFWLNKVSKDEINEILSLESMQCENWIKYLTGYLHTHRHQKQELLRQFGFLKHIVFKVLPLLKNDKEIFTLLFKMITQNSRNRREMAESMGELLRNDNKKDLLDILAEVLNNNDNFVEKYIQPAHLSHEVD
jgi:hypothetical protein